MTQHNRRIQQQPPHSNNDHDRPMDRSRRRRRRRLRCPNQRRFRSGMAPWAFILLFDWWNNTKFHTNVHMIATILPVVSSSSVSFVIPTGRRGRRRHTTTTITNHHERIASSSSSYILHMATMNGRCDISTSASQVRLVSTIPIFPLRKTVKLPGDNITLNLYEPRYRQMVEEAILCDTTADRGEQVAADHPSLPLFGAIYTTNLPHIVVPTSSSSQGTNDDNDDDTTYIVPILEPNMVGSLFIVTNHTKTVQQQHQQQQPQTVIRLNATAILRFRIIEIIHTGGYDHLVQRDKDLDAHCRNDTVAQSPHVVGPTKNNNKPYIVAKVQILSSDFDTPIGDAVHDRNGHQRPMNDDNASRHNNSDDDDDDELLPHYLGDIITQYGTKILLSHFGGTLYADVASWKTAWIRELLYFYNVSSISTFDNDKRVPLYLEQKERLRILSGGMTKMK